MKGMTVADEQTEALTQKTILASLSRAKSTIQRLEVDGLVSWRAVRPREGPDRGMMPALQQPVMEFTHDRLPQHGNGAGSV